MAVSHPVLSRREIGSATFRGHQYHTTTGLGSYLRDEKDFEISFQNCKPQHAAATSQREASIPTPEGSCRQIEHRTSTQIKSSYRQRQRITQRIARSVTAERSSI